LLDIIIYETLQEVSTRQIGLHGEQSMTSHEKWSSFGYVFLFSMGWREVFLSSCKCHKLWEFSQKIQALEFYSDGLPGNVINEGEELTETQTDKS